MPFRASTRSSRCPARCPAALASFCHTVTIQVSDILAHGLRPLWRTMRVLAVLKPERSVTTCRTGKMDASLSLRNAHWRFHIADCTGAGLTAHGQAHFPAPRRRWRPGAWLRSDAQGASSRLHHANQARSCRVAKSNFCGSGRERESTFFVVWGLAFPDAPPTPRRARLFPYLQREKPL